jgi:hypothetical protein
MDSVLTASKAESHRESDTNINDYSVKLQKLLYFSLKDQELDLYEEKWNNLLLVCNSVDNGSIKNLLSREDEKIQEIKLFNFRFEGLKRESEENFKIALSTFCVTEKQNIPTESDFSNMSKEEAISEIKDLLEKLQIELDQLIQERKKINEEIKEQFITKLKCETNGHKPTMNFKISNFKEYYQYVIAFLFFSTTREANQQQKYFSISFINTIYYPRFIAKLFEEGYHFQSAFIQTMISLHLCHILKPNSNVDELKDFFNEILNLQTGLSYQFQNENSDMGKFFIYIFFRLSLFFPHNLLHKAWN